MLQKQPCWIDRPITAEYEGQVGVAQSRNNLGRVGTHGSRLKALAAAAKALRYDGVLPELQAGQNSTNIGLHKITFTDFIDSEGLSYSLASWMGQPSNAKQCAPNHCDISSCKQSWLCQSPSVEYASVLGVSHYTALPSDRYQRAIDNGLIQARLIYGSSVTSSVDILSSSSERISQQVISTSSNVEYLRNGYLNHYAVKESCFAGGALLQQILLYDIPSKYLAAKSIDWVKNPKLNGVDGAVGTVEKLSASGLLSTQLNLAVDRALVQLAQEINVEVDTQTMYRRSKNGMLVLHLTSEKSQALLKAQVLAFHFELLKNQQFRIYAWVMRVAD